MEAYPVSVLVSVAAVPPPSVGAPIPSVPGVQLLCGHRRTHTLADLESGGVWEPFWEPDGPTSPARQRTNPCTRSEF